jgi:hypothetical protein
MGVKMTKAKLYSFNDHPEHKARLSEWAQKWINNALNCAPMTEADREATLVAIHGLYDAASIPRPERIVFTSGPVTGAVAAAIASGVWWLREHAAEHVRLGFGRTVSDTEIMAAIPLAAAYVFGGAVMPRLRIDAATDEATDEATYAATRAATYAATDAATRAATYAATDAATDAATRAATRAATYDSMLPIVARFLVLCTQHWAKMVQGGNQWSAWDSYLSFFRHITKLPLDYSKWQHWETAALHAGPRFMHAKFAIVCDRPEFIRRDSAHRPHCTDGPFCRWRDGVALYRVRGVEVPRKWIEQRETLDPMTALTSPNIEQRRAAAEIIGWSRVMEKMLPRTIDRDSDPEIGELLEVTIEHAPARFLKVRCGTGRVFVLPVPREMRTAREANAWTYGLSADEFRPEVRT